MLYSFLHAGNPLYVFLRKNSNIFDEFSVEIFWDRQEFSCAIFLYFFWKKRDIKI